MLRHFFPWLVATVLFGVVGIAIGDYQERQMARAATSAFAATITLPRDVIAAVKGDRQTIAAPSKKMTDTFRVKLPIFAGSWLDHYAVIEVRVK